MNEKERQDIRGCEIEEKELDQVAGGADEAEYAYCYRCEKQTLQERKDGKRVCSECGGRYLAVSLF